MRIAGRRQQVRQRQRQKPQAKGKRHGVGGTAAGRRHADIWLGGMAACFMLHPFAGA
jgi:hypothetical protein